MCVRFPQPSDRYSWVILAASMALTIESTNAWSSLGVFTVELMQYFDVPRQQITTIAACQTVGQAVSGILVGFLLKRCGIFAIGAALTLSAAGSLVLAAFTNHIYALYLGMGFLQGAAYGSQLAVGMACAMRSFPESSSSVSVIIAFTQSLGAAMWPPFYRLLITVFCWQGALVIMAGVKLQMIPIYMLLRRQPRSKATTLPDKSSQIKDEEARSCNYTAHAWTKKFIDWKMSMLVFTLSTALMAASYICVLTYLPMLNWLLGYDKTRGAFLLSVWSLSAGFSRVILFLIGYRYADVLNSFAATLLGLWSLTTVLYSDYKGLIAFSVILGVFSGITVGTQTAAMAENSGLEHLELGAGLLMTVQGIFSTAMNLSTGRILSATGHIRNVFLIFGTIASVASGLATAYHIMKRWIKWRAAWQQPITL